MNPLLLIVLLGIGAFALTGANAANTAKRSTIKLLSIDSFQIIGSEFVLAASVAIDNPTNNNLTVKQPYLKLLFNGSEIGNSIPSAKTVLIKANDRTPIPNVNLRMSFLSVPTIAVAVLNNKQTGQSVMLETATVVNGITVKDVKTYKIADLVNLAKKNK